MEANKLNLIVPKDYNGTPIEVIIREGKAPVALDPKEPRVVEIYGTITSPLRWLEKRIQLINQKESNIIIDRDNMNIRLIINETDFYRTSIEGSLQPSKEMIEFGINSEKNGNLSSCLNSLKCIELSSRTKQET